MNVTRCFVKTTAGGFARPVGGTEAILDLSALVFETPRPKYLPREWFLFVALALVIAALARVLASAYLLQIAAAAPLVLIFIYVERRGRVIVQPGVVRIVRFGIETELLRDRIVNVCQRAGGLQIATSDGRWIALSWPLLSRRERQARVQRLVQALNQVSAQPRGEAGESAT